ncbi:A/G-specific adenine DNA glycosylase [Acorus calamus]|uniref:Adenine DNA glycosylase n=1 Tax=Acorus calamus TaxID=4465 RepID=A0AAV9CZD3_ACOCL|nr:A/G-specific adenine DNA glycosylase [Acorus calamus]
MAEEDSITITKKRKARARRDEGAVAIRDIEDAVLCCFSVEAAHAVRDSLLRWYDKNKRDLPWRRRTHNDDVDDDDRAYAVWVSEVMLQQTRVATVVDYYHRWMERWPTLLSLSQASLEEVNEMWAGLGYYRRARYLFEGAKSIIEGGEFPRTVSDLRKVRGIGDYTAGAIASIAFNKVVPVVDGNVIRVIARLKAISANPKESTTLKKFWSLAGELVDPSRPGDFNQALMELGAVLCTPTSPGCSSCPVSDQCHALSLSRDKNGDCEVTDYPMKVAKAKQRHDFAAVCVVQIVEQSDLEAWKANKKKCVFLLVKRPEQGLLAGLWEFPSVLLNGKKTDQMTRRRMMDRYLKKTFNLDCKEMYGVVSREDVGEYVHVFSHIRLQMHVELLVLSPQGSEGEEMVLLDEKGHYAIEWKYVDDESIQSMGLTSGVRKVR